MKYFYENYIANIDLLVLFEKILQSLNEWQLAFELKYCTEKISGHHHDSVLLIIRFACKFDWIIYVRVKNC